MSWLDFGSSVASSAINFAASAYGLKKQFQYNTQLQQQAHDLNHDLQVRGYKQQGNLDRLGYRLSKKLQNYQNTFTSNMSSSAHQREVNDLRAAGLNPILSANNGASTPAAGGAIIGGGSSSVPGVGSSSVGLSDMGSPGSTAMDNYIALKSLRNNTKQTDSNVELNHSTAWRNGKEASYLGERARNEAEQYDNILAERDQIKANTSWLDQQKANSIAVTAATVDMYKKQGDAALLNAYASGLNASANDYKAKNWAMGYHGGVSNNNKQTFGVKLPFGLGSIQYGYDRGKSYNNTY